MNFRVFEVFSKPFVSHERLCVHNFSVGDEKANLVLPNLKNVVYIYEPLAPPNQLTPDEANELFAKQIRAQIDQCKILLPTKAMLFFQLPWSDIQIEFFAGDIHYPVCGTATCSSCLLEVSDFQNLIKYDCKQFEEQMFWFNNVGRVSCYNHTASLDFDCFKRYCNCWDCTAVIQIMLTYIKNMKQINALEQPLEMVILLKKLEGSRPEDQNREQWKRGGYSKRDRE